MRLILTAAVATLAIATAACENRTDDAVDANGTDAAMNADISADMNAMGHDMNAMAGNDNMAAPMAAAGFVAAAAASDMYEVESGKLAQSMGTSDAVKKFGAMLVADHTKSSSDLKAAAAASTPPATVPSAMPADHKAKIDALKAAKGAAFDRLFVEQQTAGHQTALDMLKSYAGGGDSASLKEFATKTAPVVEAHLNQLKSMKL